MSKIILKLKNKMVFRVNIKASKKSNKGDFDIMLDAGKSMVFDYAVAGNFFRVFEKEVNAISWHGFYEKRSPHSVLMPVVHFKKKVGKTDKLRHFGAISIKECIPFPVCSVYIPAEIDVSSLSNSHVSKDKNFVIDIDDDCLSNNVRYDFFVFPKGFSFESFEKSYASVIFETQSVDVFNNGGELSAPEYNVVPTYHELNDGENVLLRKVVDPSDMYKKLGNYYSVVIHEPKDVYNILNRPIITKTEDGVQSQPIIMQEAHEEAIRKS